MNLFESFAVSHYLSYWPDNMTYLEIIKELDADSDDIIAQNIYHDLNANEIATMIDDLKYDIETLLKKVFKKMVEY